MILKLNKLDFLDFLKAVRKALALGIIHGSAI